MMSFSWGIHTGRLLEEQWPVTGECWLCGLPRDIGNRLTVVLYDTDKYEATLQEIEMYTDDIIRRYEGQLHHQ